jgi:hypothetical protein
MAGGEPVLTGASFPIPPISLKEEAVVTGGPEKIAENHCVWSNLYL